MADFFASSFWTGFLWPLIVMVAQSVLLLVVLLIAIAYILLADRKIWAAVQIRRGPNVVGPWGLLQSFADLLKFVLKEPVIPSGSNKGVFLLAPLVSCVLALAAWAVIPMDLGWVISDINVGVLYIFAISSLSIYGVIMAGWSSNSKYPFLAALRSAAQMVSYEVSIGFVIITVLAVRRLAQSLGRGGSAEHQRARQPDRPAAAHHPELVCVAAVPDVRGVLRLGAGRDQPAAVRPGGSRIRTGRGLHDRIRLDAVSAVHARRICRDHHDVRAGDDPVPRRLAAAGGLPPFTWIPGVIWFALKVFFMFFMFAMAKAIVPRYRYDQLMRLGWKVFLPMSLAAVVIVAGCAAVHRHCAEVRPS